ncbi:fibrinogen C domain-containing protein 1-like [Amphiura filiformis]|uniref:fibrinogen C domain-containing protein 1-like n=1 Tax=Amphiura filiformis TaxID=82378 RepID=UPI003B218B62
MAVSMIKLVLIFSITMVTLDNVNCQLTINVNGIQQIISLLENVNDTSVTSSSVLPQMQSSVCTGKPARDSSEHLPCFTNNHQSTSLHNSFVHTRLLPSAYSWQLPFYEINIGDGLLFDVYCEMDTDGGNWTVFQRRFDGSVDFYRNWTDYEEGFGSLDGEFWAGLELVHQLTSSGSWELQVQLEDFTGGTAYANYPSFSIGDAASNYTLHYGSYSGTAGTYGSLYYTSNNRPFSTKDRDNDAKSSGHCAQDRQGAWWYGNCAYANLNGKYLGATGNGPTAMYWYHWKSSRQSLKSSTMMIRPVQ